MLPALCQLLCHLPALIRKYDERVADLLSHPWTIVLGESSTRKHLIVIVMYWTRRESRIFNSPAAFGLTMSAISANLALRAKAPWAEVLAGNSHLLRLYHRAIG